MSAFGVRRNAIRFELLNDLAMDRLEFSRNVLQKGLGFHPRNLDFIFAFPGKKTFEVIFSTFAMFEFCLEKFKKFGDQFKNIAMVPLTRRELKVIHVVMFSELVQYEDILTWLSQYCDVIVGSTVKDEDGVKTGERKFQVKLRRDIVSGDYKHLPNTIQIGSCRGYVFYMGQPKVCRSCGQAGHFSANCDQKFCRNCGAFGHFSNECKLPLKCNLCGESNHVFRDCPFAYANRVKKQRAVKLSEKPTESSAEVDPEPTSVSELPVEGLGLENLFQEPESEPGPKLDPEPESAPVSETTEDRSLATEINVQFAQQSNELKVLEEVNLLVEALGSVETEQDLGETDFLPGTSDLPGLKLSGQSDEEEGEMDFSASESRKRKKDKEGADNSESEAGSDSASVSGQSFLDSDNVSTFASATHMRIETSEGMESTKGKKKKKGKSGRKQT
ncbi:UNVERIFIED_CONTAM: hypothetical protein FKN15_023670 [Acipenser sinensis]